MNGAVIYRGPSLLDNRPIVAIVTGLASGSSNTKTGAMLQTWILPDTGLAPHLHVANGTDRTVCGTCPFASRKGCYVQVWQGPRSVYAAYQRGRYLDFSGAFAFADDTSDYFGIVSVGAGSLVRVGSYGDPAAVPLEVWDALLSCADGWVGYTHQWRNPAFRGLQRYCQASCETASDVARARADGWGCFVVIPQELESSIPDAVPCPASAEMGHVASCATCRKCDGSSRHVVTIRPHGGKARQVADVARRRSRILPTLSQENIRHA